MSDLINENYNVEFKITNFKSYLGDPILLKIIKPITIIAGPNGEGKSNLLEAMLVGVSNFLKHSRKFRTTGLLTKPIKVSTRPEINLSLHDFVFSNSLIKNSSDKSYPERLDPRNIVSRGKRRSNIQFTIIRQSGKRERKLVEMTTSITRTSPFMQHSGYINNIEDLEFIYLNPDTSLTDLFVKLVGQEFSHQLTSILGTSRKAEYSSHILSFFSKDEDRLICDIDDGKFEEKYFKGRNVFLTSNLPTGAKKECILYLFGILTEKLKDKQDWLAIFLIDEIESGLHASRQKTMIDALTDAFKENKTLYKHVKIIMTTHSPIIYSELMKNPDIVDTYFVLRNPTESSKIYKYDDVVGDELIEKRILAELGLNIYDLPNTILFVEGKSDKEFWLPILDNVTIIPLRGASIPNVLTELLEAFPIARSKKYHVVVDRSAYNKIDKDVQKLNEKNVIINCKHINYDSIEELIFDIKLDSGNPADLWETIGNKVQYFRDNVNDSEKVFIDINIEKVKEKLEKKGTDGISDFFNSIKNMERFYDTLGKNWSFLLEKEPKEIIEKIKSDIETS